MEMRLVVENADIPAKKEKKRRRKNGIRQDYRGRKIMLQKCK